MPYTPLATDVTQPTNTGVLASTAAAEFRALKLYMRDVLLAGIDGKAGLAASPVFTSPVTIASTLSVTGGASFGATLTSQALVGSGAGYNIGSGAVRYGNLYLQGAADFDGTGANVSTLDGDKLFFNSGFGTTQFDGANTTTPATIATSVGLRVTDPGKTTQLMRVTSSETTIDGLHTVGAGNLRSGVYTPTATLVSNVASCVPSQFFWSRVGNVVTVSGYIAITTNNATSANFRLSLPIASAFSSSEQAAGSATNEAGTAITMQVRSNAANDNFEVAIGTNPNGLFQSTFHATYLIQ